MRNLETERLRGEPVTADHAGILLERLYSDPRVMATLGGGTRTLEQVRAALIRFSDPAMDSGHGAWVFSSRREGEVAGLGGIMPYDLEEGRVPGLIYHLAHDSWGRGLATEIARALLRCGFDDSGFGSVYSWTMPDNLASRRVMEKSGMIWIRDGTFRNLPHAFYAANRVRDAEGNAVPEFGTRESGKVYVERPTAYAVVRNADGEVAAVRGGRGLWLPGGGIHRGETPEEAVAREVREETGYGLRNVRRIGEAIQYFFARSEERHYMMRAVFFGASFEGEPQGPAEYELLWLEGADPVARFFHESHGWATRRA